MAGIFGGIGFHDAGVRERSLKTLATVARHGLDLQTATHSFESAAIGIACPDHYSARQLFVSRDDSHACLIFGIVYVNGQLLTEVNFEHSFLQRFLASPEQLLTSLDGTFAIAIVSNEECTLINDPFGTFATHYTEHNGGFLFSSQMEALRELRSEQSFNDEALGSYIGLGTTLNGQTPFKDIFRLPSGSMLQATKSGVRIERYFTPTYRADGDAQTHIANIRQSFEASIDRLSQISGAIAALTGGFDSRATWSVLLGHGTTISAHTHGLPGCNDLAISHQIATRHNIAQDTLLFSEQFLCDLPAHWSEVIRRTEGGVTIAHTPTFEAFKYLSRSNHVLIDSYGGAFYRRQRMKVAEKRIDTSKDIVPQLLQYERTPLLAASLLKPDVRIQIHRASERALREYYDSISETPLLGDKLDRFHFEQIDAMRDSLAANAQMDHVGLAHPFMTRAAIETAAMLPLDIRRRNAVHRDIVHAEFPALEAFAMDNTGFTVPYRGFNTLRYLPMAAERALQFGASILPGLARISLRSPTMDFAHLLRPAIAQVRELTLSSHPTYDTLIDRAAVEDRIARFEAGHIGGGAIMQLISLRLFLDQFA